MNNQPTATGLPGQSGITESVPVPLPVRPVPAVPPVDLYRAPNGMIFRAVGADEDGVLLFIPANLDPDKVLRMVWAREDDLVDAFGGRPMVPVGRVA